ncbi:recombinase family protein [Magnetospirillum sp. SS-4]|uniref:recombinase family protein n=1 Tax=Magnetospirillum sp. SS-4 TaxID=2681465 RepID=UPI00137EBEEC|nr:recombinase family protein [Magnetospirillum sp. SS-4]CAA7626903.1 Site-specific recombinase [Magnetospirillum sp. SS-4]
MIVGYYRQLTQDSDGAASPMAILRAERCLRIVSDEAGRSDARTQLIASLGNGDVLVSPSIAHFTVSTTELLRVAQVVHGRGVTLRLVAEKIDTEVPAARNVIAVLAEFNRKIMTARRQTGMWEAQLRGAAAGRPRKLDLRHVATIRDELTSGRTYASVARDLGVHPTTVMRLMQRVDGGDGK